MDSSIDAPEEGTSDDLPVAIGTLEIDGLRPKVGDPVDLKVSGSITKIVDETAFVKPDTVNDQPMAPKVQATDEQNLRAQAQALDASSGGVY